MKTEHTTKGAITLSVELTTEHFSAIDYAVSRMVRTECDTVDDHNYKRKLLSEVLDIASNVFSNIIEPLDCQNDGGKM